MSAKQSPISRRHVLAGLVVAPTLVSRRVKAKEKTIAALFAGSIKDRGFMEAGYQGLQTASNQAGYRVTFKDGIKPEKDLLVQALRELAREAPDLVIAHGGQNSAAAQIVAEEFPQTLFAVTQGNVIGANLSSYEVLQEQSAFLAGAMAAWTTKTGIVGHMSGIRVVPGLKGRAAYANGVAFADPNVKLLTNFSGNQDDNALSRKVATAMIEKGADIIFTMLNSGRIGTIDACREKGVKQIGNVGDWVATAPDVFIASAIANSGLAVSNAILDIAASRFKSGVIQRIGLEQAEAVRLSMASNIPQVIQTKVANLSTDILTGRLNVSTDWVGEEFLSP